MNTVYVRWYGSVLQGEIVENRSDGILAGMVAVRIKIQGMNATALYTPSHIYQSAAEAEPVSGNIPQISQNSPNVSENPREISRSGQNVSTMTAPSEEWQRLQQFKAEHWDQERGHLRIDCLDEFYRLWCDSIAKRMEMMQPKKPITTMAMEKPATPAEAMQPVKRIVSDQRMAELKQQLKQSLKPKKPIKAVQLSLFD